MACKVCDSQNTDYVVLETIKDSNFEGYVWEETCNDCGNYDTGYEF